MKRVITTIFGFLLIISVVFATYTGMQGKTSVRTPNIVTTIKPIHSIVSNLSQGIFEPVLLLPDNASPHTYTLKASSVQQISQAALIIWVGKDLESFLENSVQNKEPSKVLTLIDLTELTLLTNRTGDAWHHSHTHEHSHAHDSHEHEHNHAHKSIDNHIWLSIDNMKIIAKHIAEKLITIDLEHKEIYKTNLTLLLAKLDKLDKDITRKLNKKTNPFLVFHDAYQYLELQHKLNNLGTIIVPHSTTSAKRINDINKLVQKGEVACIFYEPQFNQDIIDNILEDSTTRDKVKVLMLDPLGSSYPAGTNNYFDTMQGLAETIETC